MPTVVVEAMAAEIAVIVAPMSGAPSATLRVVEAHVPVSRSRALGRPA